VGESSQLFIDERRTRKLDSWEGGPLEIPLQNSRKQAEESRESNSRREGISDTAFTYLLVSCTCLKAGQTYQVATVLLVPGTHRVNALLDPRFTRGKLELQQRSLCHRSCPVGKGHD